MNVNVNPRGAMELTQIRKRMKAAGVTQADVARLANVSWRMVHYVLMGERTSPRVIVAIGRLLGKVTP